MSRLSNGIALGVAGTALALSLAVPGHGQTIPTDAQPICAVSAPAFAAMFESGTPTLNGVVKPADSQVNLSPNCGFFNWTEQMYLWLTSPAPSRYGGGGRIMFSPTFYTVSPPFVENGQTRRKFIQNNPRLPINMFLRATELGPHMLPATITKTGQLVEVARPDPRKPVAPVVRASNGALVRLTDAKRTSSGEVQLFSAGKPIVARKLTLPMIKRPMVKMPAGPMMAVVPRAEVANAIQARKIVINGLPILIDSNSNVIDVESGQAGGGGVLLSQNGSLIYYITAVNDVFAYSRTMRGAAVIPDNTSLTMPLTAADANAIVAFAAAHGRTIVDPEALAIETKSSWVEASAVPNPQDYVTVRATIPTFTKSTDPVTHVETWTPSGQKTVTLAMAAIHVVGSTLGHGEMVWGSFEHFGNSPNAAYTYNSTSGPNPKTVPQSTAGTWLFAPSNSAGPFNAETASWNDVTGAITGEPAVLPMAVMRMHPWGSVGTNASMNTQVISSTASIMGMLLAGDVRRNYFQIGTTWTIGGAAPNGSNEVGTNLLANSTLETFMQANASGSNPGTNCFDCHQTNKTTVSHSYNMLKPLF
ncbi:hypothetical protein [Sphingomonas bacterium]|uniref:hypothetical protein n=1 Tax=Sphingomonas bacterium TaxID=1895847 RepID=UPI0026320BC3|nr:hypothetical protein [Sphingomonas bacterium]MDB5680066.1 hypothetical protein [Sphingomonas bacterium]